MYSRFFIHTTQFILTFSVHWHNDTVPMFSLRFFDLEMESNLIITMTSLFQKYELKMFLQHIDWQWNGFIQQLNKSILFGRDHRMLIVDTSSESVYDKMIRNWYFHQLNVILVTWFHYTIETLTFIYCLRLHSTSLYWTLNSSRVILVSVHIFYHPYNSLIKTRKCVYEIIEYI